MSERTSFIEYLIVYLVKAIGSFFRLIPIQAAFFIARWLGSILSVFNQKRKRIAYANLKSAFGGRYTPAQLRRIIKTTYSNIGQGTVEVLLLPKIDKRYLTKYIEFENFHIAEDMQKNKKSFIFVTAHFGAWELAQAALPLRGFPYKGIAREQKPYLLNAMLNQYREAKGSKILMKGPAVKGALKELRSGGIVAMLVDQNAGKRGIFTNFFGRPASWNRGVMEMALKTGAEVVPGFAIRKKGPYVKIKLFDPLEFSDKEDKAVNVLNGFNQYTEILGSVISDYPEQWLWQHKRWKATPVRKVLVLNDGKTGHLRQSEAVVKIIKDIWQEKGFSPEDIKTEIISVQCKNSFFKKLFSLCGLFSHKGCQGCMRCAYFCLDKDTFSRLIKTYADIVISCGTSLADVNSFISKENNAKSIIIMKPPFLKVSKFDLAIVPRHDNPLSSKKIIKTDGALNLIDKNRTENYKAKLVEKTGKLSEKVIGVLIGGTTKDFSLEKSAVSELLDNIILAADSHDADILLSTSRRTPKDIEELIEKKAKVSSRCKLTIIANKENVDGAVEGIIGLSDIVLTTQESISMVSEAAASDSHALVFRQQAKMNKRHERFLTHLSRKGFVQEVSKENIGLTIKDVFKNGSKQSKLDDASRVKERIRDLL